MSTPPSDPRTDLPPFGTLATVERVDEVAVRVLAPNPSPMTLDGTNTYVLFADDGAPAVVVDPGPADAEHRAVVDQVIAEHDLDVACVFACVACVASLLRPSRRCCAFSPEKISPTTRSASPRA